jgi:SGNH domain-containing protein
MRPSGARAGATVLVAATCVVASVVAVGASIAPGTPKEVAALVTLAPTIALLPADLTPPLASASSDDALTEYPTLNLCVSGYNNEPACVYGDRHGSHTMVLFGDSHALMWFPPLDAIAKAAKWRLVALMALGCPVADVTVWNIVTNSPDPYCPSFRQHMIRRIDRLDPSLVVVSEGFYTLDAQHQTISDEEWTGALEASLNALHGKSLRKVLIGQSFPIPNPVACIAANPDGIQSCSRQEGTPTFTAELAADQAATTASKVAYVNEVPWTCSATCTVVIGSMIAYNSAGHLSATYATYLTDVLRLALKASMR